MLKIEQIDSSSFSLLSYVIFDEASHEGIIVDPPLYMYHYANLDLLKIRAVINTHIHPDHTMGNRSLSKMSPVLAHTRENTWYLRLYNSVLTAALTGKPQARISFSLKDKERIVLGENPIQVLHTPGHSPGSICLHWEGNLVSGDLVFAEGIGRTDLPGGSMAHLKKSIAIILGLGPETIIWPGHSYGNRKTAVLKEIKPFLSRVLTSK